MQFCDFLSKIYKRSACNNQSQFVLEFFSAFCGEEEPLRSNNEKDSLYSKYLPSGLTGYDSTYRKRLFRETKYTRLSSPIKEYILSNQNKDTFFKYLNFTLTENNFKELCADFELSIYTEKIALFEGVFEQFIEFAKNREDSADNVIQKTIEKYLSIKPTERKIDLSSLYPNDMGIIENGNNIVYEKDCYQKFNHSWLIKNIGAITWEERYYEICKTTSLKTNPYQIKIPVLRPKEETVLTVAIDTRHFEGNFELAWTMRNKDKQECFPEKSLQLKLTVNVYFKNTIADKGG